MIASGLRALLDLVYERKIEWHGIDFLTESLRIEIDSLTCITRNDFDEMLKVYNSKRVLNFLKKFKKVFYG